MGLTPQLVAAIKRIIEEERRRWDNRYCRLPDYIEIAEEEAGLYRGACSACGAEDSHRTERCPPKGGAGVRLSA